MPTLLERHQQGGLIVHALLATQSMWKEHPPIANFIDKYQLIHPPERTLEEMEQPERRKYLNELAKRILDQTQIGFLNRYKPSRRGSIMEQVEEIVKPDGLELTCEIASGDTSVIYRAKGGIHDFAVKAMISTLVSDAGQTEILREVEKCRNLRDPAFIKIYKLLFDQICCISTTDLVSGNSLKHHLRWLSQGRNKKGKPWYRIATSILLQLAKAIAESHEHRLRFLKIDAANILVEDGRPRIYPIDFSSWLTSAAHGRGSLSISMESLPYLAPEYFHKSAQRTDLMLPPKGQKECNEEELEVKRLADQYSLGMVALTLLEKSVPVQVDSLADVQKLLEFQAEPRSYRGNDKMRLEDRPWRRESPALARVIWRMLEPDPTNRWDSMSTVVSQLMAVLGSTTEIQAHVSEVKECYSKEYFRQRNLLQRLLPQDVKNVHEDQDEVHGYRPSQTESASRCRDRAFIELPREPG